MGTIQSQGQRELWAEALDYRRRYHGVIGVASKNPAQSIREYNGHTHYNEWQFIPLQQSTRGGGGGTSGAAGPQGLQGGRGGQGGQSGLGGQGGRGGTQQGGQRGGSQGRGNPPPPIFIPPGGPNVNPQGR